MLFTAILIGFGSVTAIAVGSFLAAIILSHDPDGSGR